jgi:hypothetical protein
LNLSFNNWNINKIYIKIKYVIVKHQVINFSSISWQDDDDVSFVLDQGAEVDF